MKKYFVLILATAVLAVAIVVVKNRSPQPNDHAGPAMSPHGEAPAMGAAFSGTVIETMDAGSYTYVHVEAGGRKVWAAGPTTDIAVGDEVSFSTGMVMTDFTSETLGRTFESIYFVPALNKAGAEQSGLPPGHPPVTPAPEMSRDDFAGIEVPSGGYSIASIYADKDALAGKDVTVRGKVVKFTAGVMDRNWIHIQDGSGADDAGDLTITTNAMVDVGDIVLARGALAIDKDFGFGYVYEVIVEEARVTIEQSGRSAQ